MNEELSKTPSPDTTQFPEAALRPEQQKPVGDGNAVASRRRPLPIRCQCED